MAVGITTVLVAVVAAILVLFTVQDRNLRQAVSREKVLEAARAVREKFQEITSPINMNLSTIAKWGASGVLDVRDTQSLNRKCIPFLDSLTKVSSLIIADIDGREYFLLRKGPSWLTRSAASYRPDMDVTLKRWNRGGELQQTWREKRTFDPRKRIWFAGALQLSSAGAIFWTEPYRFKTVPKMGITASTRWQTRGEKRVITVAAMDVLLDDLYLFLSGLHVTPASRVLLIRNNGSVMAPHPVNQDQITSDDAGAAFIARGSLTKGLIKDAVEVWEKIRTQTSAVAEFTSEGKTWWAGFRPLERKGSGTWIGVVIPDEDLSGNFRKRWLNVILIGAAILIAGSILMVYLIRRYSQKYELPSAEKRRTESTDNDLLQMISRGEGSGLEFKSTLRTNLKTGKADKAIELAWLKTVVAFMNSEGGTLLIGVADDAGIEGIRADGFENLDKCRLHVKNLLNQHIGAEFSRYVDCDLRTIEGKTIVVITCQKAADPVFLTVGKNEDFFIRSGPSSIKLSMSKMVKYMQQRK